MTVDEIKALKAGDLIATDSGIFQVVENEEDRVCVATVVNKSGEIDHDSLTEATLVRPSGGGSGSGLEDAPSDGKLYGRQDAAWAEVKGSSGGGGGGGSVQKTGDTMTGPLTMASGEPFTEAVLASGALTIGTAQGMGVNIQPGSMVINDQFGHHTTMNPAGEIALADDSSGDALILDPNKVALGAGSETLALSVDANGDLIISGLYGINAGKSINLTAGKWA